MENLSFHPTTNRSTEDVVSVALRRIAQTVLVITLGLFPLIFIPAVSAPFNFSKTLILLIGIVIALVCIALAVLRDGSLPFSFPSLLTSFWCIAIAYVVATVFSGDVKDSFIGDVFSAQTTAFMLLMAVLASLMLVLRTAPGAIIRLYMFLFASAAFLAVFHLVRVMVGVDTISLEVLPALTDTPFGSWNGLAILFGLVVLLSIVAIEQLPVGRIGRLVFAGAIFLSLAMLALINFFTIWLVLAGVSTVTFVYALVRKHYQEAHITFDQSNDTGPVFSIAIIGAVLLIAVTFVIGGSAIGTAVANMSGVSHIEVRPSHSATFEILKDVYATSPITGIGPNRFVDAWRLHKDPSINDTLFWGSAFEAGSGFVPTSFVTTGALGVAAWLVFFILLIWNGFQALFQQSNVDVRWRFIATSSFVGALYLWVLAIVYTPSASVMVLAAAFTGIFAASYMTIVPQPVYSFGFANGRSTGLILVGIVVCVLVGSAASVYGVGQHYMSVYRFLNVPSGLSAENIAVAEAMIADAFERSESDVYIRSLAQLRSLQMQTLLSSPSANGPEQAQFQEVTVSAIASGQRAVEIDPTEPLNHIVLGQIYSALALADVEGAYERADESYSRARELDPQNPYVVLLQAQLEARDDNMVDARALAEEAIRMKRNYTDALFFLTQLDILEDNVAAAIVRARSIVTIEPQNPARYYQLGILYSTEGELDEAIAAFERAIALDSQYANARYFLAAAYSESGRFREAMEQMRIVESLNPGNQVVAAALENLEAGRTVTAQPPSVQSTESIVEDGQEVTPESVEDTSLVVPVNTVPEPAGTSTTADSE